MDVAELHRLPPEQIDQYDFCLIFPLTPGASDATESIIVSKEADDIIQKLVLAFGKKYIYQYNKETQSLRYVLIKGSISRIRAKAEHMKYKMLLDEDNIKDAMLEGDRSRAIAPLTIPHHPLSSNIRPYQHIHARYRCDDELQDYYWRHRNLPHPFRRSIRIRFIHHILQESEKFGGVGINLRKLSYQGIITAYYPLHSWNELDDLEYMWTRFFGMVWNQPIFQIKDYFGERVGLFFTFLEHLHEQYAPPAALGIIFQIILLVLHDYNLPVNAIYSAFVCAWFAFTISFWKRREKLTALCWGTSDLINKVDYSVRPEFIGLVAGSAIDGSETVDFSQCHRHFFFLTSIIICVTLIVASCGRSQSTLMIQ